jgi:hypothetical protein
LITRSITVAPYTCPQVGSRQWILSGLGNFAIEVLIELLEKIKDFLKIVGFPGRGFSRNLRLLRRVVGDTGGKKR